MPDALLKANALRLAISNDIALAYNVTYPTLSALQKIFQRQQTIKWNADVGGAGTVIKDVSEAAGSAAQGSVEPANLAIGQTAVTHTFDIILTEAEEAASVGIEALRDLFQAHVSRGLTKIYRDINAKLFSATGVKNDIRMIGMEKVIDNTFAYAGIDPATYPGWTSVVGVGSGTTLRDLTPELLTDFTDIRLLNAEASYDLIITTPAIAKKYKDLFASNRQFTTSGERSQTADMGISDIFYNGRPVIADPACTANTVYFLDSAEIFFHSYRVKEDAVNGGIAVKIGMLAQNNVYAEKWEMGVIPQLQVFSRKACNALRYVQ